MINDNALAARGSTGSLIDDHGFTAILRKDVDGAFGGVIGMPRVAPTCSGLSIEDSYGAAIDSIILGLLEDFAFAERLPDVAEDSEAGNRATPHDRFCMVAA